MRTLVVVTRHNALVQYLIKNGIVPEGTQAVSHASEDVVRGQQVIGVLPMRLAALTRSFTEVSLTLRPDQRGKELTLEDIEGANPQLTTYEVKVIR